MTPDAQKNLDDRLLVAGFTGDTRTVRLPLAARADVHTGNDYALRWAALNGHTETVQVLARHIFAPDSWRGKSRAEIEAQATALYDKIKASGATPECLLKAAKILADCAIDCWHQVRPAPPSGFKISPIPAQPRPV